MQSHKSFFLLILFIGLWGIPTPVFAQSPFGDLEVITPENADRIEQLAVLGRGKINALTWSADGNTLAVGTSLGILLYDGNDLTAPPDHFGESQWIKAITFHPHEPWLAVIDGDYQVSLWDIETDSKLATLGELHRGTMDLAFNDDGTLLAAGTGYMVGEGMRIQAVTIWEITDPTQPESCINYEEHGGLDSLIFVDDLLLIISPVKFVALDVYSGEPVFSQHRSPGAYGSNAAINPDGQTVVFNGMYGMYGLQERSLENLLSSQPQETVTYQEALYIETVAYSADGRYLFGTGGPRIQVWDTQTAELLATVSDLNRPQTYGQESLAPHPKHDFMVFSDSHGLNLLRYDDWEACESIDTGFTMDVFDLALSPDDNQIAINPWLQLWNLEPQPHLDSMLDRRMYDSVSFHIDGNGILYHPDGNLITVYPNYVRIWDTTTHELIAQLEHNGLNGASLSPDGRWLATRDWDYSDYPVRLWNLTTFEENIPFSEYIKEQNLQYGLMMFAPDSTKLAIQNDVRNGEDAPCAWLFDLISGEMVGIVQKPYGCNLQSFLFSPDGGQLNVSGDVQDILDNKIAADEPRLQLFTGLYTTYTPDSTHIATAFVSHFDLRDAQSGERIAQIDTGERIQDISVNPGSTLFAVSVNHDVWLIDAQDGTVVNRLQGHLGRTWQSIFSHDGTFIVTGSNDGTARIWGVPADKED